MGQWQRWQDAALEVLPAGNLLEIGHGPGHLLLKIRRKGRVIIGIDASRQMVRMASRRLKKNSFAPLIAHARVQELPFPDMHFQAALSTFPSDFIFDPESIHEISRVLTPQGTFIIIGLAYITGKTLPDRLAAWLYRITGQAPEVIDGWDEPFTKMGFEVRLDRVVQERAIVLRVVAHKSPTFATGHPTE
jgi:ubiquinone/menaquinone biosynthesis C-methylase UbiE